VSPVEVLDAHLAVIARVNPKLMPLSRWWPTAARRSAKDAEAAVMRGDKLRALHGLPVVIKDVTPTAGIRTTYGSPLFKDKRADRGRRSGATPESGRRHRAWQDQHARSSRPAANTFNDVFGVTRNPWNPALSPAGSSGGSAVAVATGMAPLGAGHGFRCSIRMPASFCGIVGIRPTAGLTRTGLCRSPGTPVRSRTLGAHRRRCRPDAGRDRRF